MPDQPKADQRQEKGGLRAGAGIAMTEHPPAPYRPHPSLKRVEKGLESILFNSRWLMAPYYLGLVVSLAVLLLKFCMLLWEFVVHAPGVKESDIILGVLLSGRRLPPARCEIPLPSGRAQTASPWPRRNRRRAD